MKGLIMENIVVFTKVRHFGLCSRTIGLCPQNRSLRSCVLCTAHTNRYFFGLTLYPNTELFMADRLVKSNWLVLTAFRTYRPFLCFRTFNFPSKMNENTSTYSTFRVEFESAVRSEVSRNCDQ